MSGKRSQTRIPKLWFESFSLSSKNVSSFTANKVSEHPFSHPNTRNLGWEGNFSKKRKRKKAFMYFWVLNLHSSFTVVSCDYYSIANGCYTSSGFHCEFRMWFVRKKVFLFVLWINSWNLHLQNRQTFEDSMFHLIFWNNLFTVTCGKKKKEKN